MICCWKTIVLFMDGRTWNRLVYSISACSSGMFGRCISLDLLPCRCCSNYYISMGCHVHTFWIEWKCQMRCLLHVDCCFLFWIFAWESFQLWTVKYFVGCLVECWSLKNVCAILLDVQFSGRFSLAQPFNIICKIKNTHTQIHAKT